MFERFTEPARQVVVLAQEEARRLGHGFIGSEHLLLGLLREEHGGAAVVLESLEVTPERVRAQVVRIVGRGETASAGQIPFTAHAKEALELALREALALGLNYIGTEHILLGLARADEGVAARILHALGADSARVRDDVLQMLASTGRLPRGADAPRGIAHARLAAPWLAGVEPLPDQLGPEIRRELGRDPDVGDLLLLAAGTPGTLPARALAALGVDLPALAAAIDGARTQATDADADLARQLREARHAKEQAIEGKEFERAAGLRDTERHLQQRQARATPQTSLEVMRTLLRLPPPR